MSVHQMETWRQNRQTHSWATLDGENYACSFCDTKTGRDPCPEGRMLDAQIDQHQADLHRHAEYKLAGKVERGEADQLTDYGQANYTLDTPDPTNEERPF